MILFPDDGSVRVWRNYDQRPELVTAWQALSGMLPSTRGKTVVQCELSLLPILKVRFYLFLNLIKLEIVMTSRTQQYKGMLVPVRTSFGLCRRGSKTCNVSTGNCEQAAL